MTRMIRTLLLASACIAFAPGLALAEDGIVAPGSARDIKLMPPDAAKKTDPKLDPKLEGMQKVRPPTEIQVSPPEQKVREVGDQMPKPGAN
jgi:hypothetical protein